MTSECTDMMSFVHKTREKDVVGILTSDLIGLLPTNHNIAYITMEYTGVCEETFDFNSKIAQTTQNFHCRKVESTRNGKLRGLSGRFQTLIWRPGETVQNLESPGLSGSVDSTEVTKCFFSSFNFIVYFCFKVYPLQIAQKT